MPLVRDYKVHCCAIFLAGTLFMLPGCGGSSPATSSGGFGMSGSNNTNPAVSAVALSPATVTGGGVVSVTVTMASPVPAAEVTVQLASSNPATLQMPPTLQIAAGQSSATVEVSAAAVELASSVSITASYGNSAAGATLNVVPATNVPFTVTVQPTTVTVLQGKSGTSKITTKAASGYSHALQLKISGDPVGVSSSAKPTSIPAPGSGTSTLTTNALTDTETGSYPLTVTATDGTNSATAKVTLSVISGTTNPSATFKGCWYKNGGNQYQGVDISVKKPGTYPFNAVLYSGTTCNANDYADQFGFGDPLTLGNSNYTMWFTDFKDQANMSAIWYLGDENSKCVNYATAPAC